MNKKSKITYKVEEYSSDGISFIKITALKKYFSVTLADLGASIYDVFFLQRRMTLTPKYISILRRQISIMERLLDVSPIALKTPKLSSMVSPTTLIQTMVKILSMAEEMAFLRVILNIK